MLDSSAARVAAPRQNSTPSVSYAFQVHHLTTAELARNKIIEEYLPFVRTVLAKVQRGLPAYINADDLYSAGVTGLIAAAERFDPAQAHTFPGYVCLRIRGAMLDELRRLDCSSRRCRSWHKQVQIAIEESEQALGRVPTDQELSARLNISVAEFVRRRRTATPVRIISLDAQPGTDAGMANSLYQFIADDAQEDVRETMEKEDRTQLLMKKLAELPDIPKKILALYYFEGLRFSEIAEVFDLTESRICQIHKEAVAKLRASVRVLTLGRPHVSEFIGTLMRSGGVKSNPVSVNRKAKLRGQNSTLERANGDS